MKKLILPLFLFFGQIICLGQNQDKLILKDKTSIEGKIIQVTSTEVEIQPSEGNPFLKYSRSEVAAIIYADNTVITFDDNESEIYSDLSKGEISLHGSRIIPTNYGQPDNIYYPKWIGNSPKETFNFKDNNITATIIMNYDTEKYYDRRIIHNLVFVMRALRISGQFIVNGKSYFVPIYEVVDKKDKDYRHTLQGGGGEYFLVGDNNIYICDNLFLDFSLYTVEGFDIKLDIYIHSQ